MGTMAETPRVGGNGRLTEDDLLSAMPTRSVNREARVGIFVLVGVIAFFAVLLTMTDVGTFRGRYYLNTMVEDAGGMRRGDPVQMRGVNIGRVTGFDMVPGGVAVRLELYDEYEVPADSRVAIESAGLLGGMIVEVVPGNSPEEIEDGATIPGVSAAGADLMGTAAALGTQADSVLSRANALLSQETVGAVNQSAVELRTLLTELSGLAAQQRQELAALSGSLRRSAEGVERATTGGELERSVTRIDSLTLRLDQTTQSLNRASGSLETVLARMERGEGTLGKLSQDEALYTNLNATVTSLNELVAEIKANPKKYLSVSVF